MKIIVLLGGISPERNISLLSGRAATAALRAAGHDVRAIDPARGNAAPLTDAELAAATPVPVTDAELASFQPRALVDCVFGPAFDDVDAVFLALHGRYGEDGYVQSLLDLRGVRYTGSGMLASALAMDKAASKLMFETAGIPTPPWVMLLPGQEADEALLDRIVTELVGDMVVKPNDQGSTVGMTIVPARDIDALHLAVQLAGRYSQSVLVERYIPGRELTVAVLGDQALPIIEIAPKEGFYDYSNKYTKGRTDYICPAELPDHVQEHVQNLAVAAHGVLGCKAYSRVDFRMTDDNMVFCLEVNTLPGFTETSLVPMAARTAGMDFETLCGELLRLAVEA